jgi:hypothetical protein
MIGMVILLYQRFSLTTNVLNLVQVFRSGNTLVPRSDETVVSKVLH